MTLPAPPTSGVPRRFVALGDSFTEGVGDWKASYPNGVRGWADRVAKHLAKQDPALEYVNLAVRSRRLRQIVDEQLDRAIALRPTWVSFFAGGNDLLDIGTDPRTMLETYGEAVGRLAATGARVLLFTSYDLRISRMLEPFRPRNDLYNSTVRQLAAEHDAVLVDHRAMPEYDHPRLWDSDRMHMSTAGHKLLASRVLDALDVPWSFDLDDVGPPEPLDRWARWARERQFWRDHLIPLFGRKLRGVTLGDDLPAKWPEPVRPAEGLRRLEKRRRRERRSGTARDDASAPVG